jgi:hypothetical protein
MNAKQQLINLVQYFDNSRQVGHTTAMINGAKQTDCIIISHNYSGSEYIKTLYPKGKVVALPAIEHELKGQHQPVLLDNAAVVQVVQIALGEIERLERKITSMKRAAQEILSA